MHTGPIPNFQQHLTPGAAVQPGLEAGAWHLEIPPGPAGRYRLAQLDDYTAEKRALFPHVPPLTLELRARVSAANLPGTWGFGLWNDPFSLSLGFGGGTRRFPALPNTAWFFFAAPQNYLSFWDDLPANGLSAQTFQAVNVPAPLLALGALGFPLLMWPRLARALRPWFRRVIREDNFALLVDVTQWHHYSLVWREEGITFKVDDQLFETRITPNSRLGLVLWIDNQFAAFRPNGQLAYGTLENPQSAWLEIEEFSLS